MGSMQWQLGREMGTIPAFASRTQENQENLGRDGQKTWVEMARGLRPRSFLLFVLFELYEGIGDITSDNR